MGKVYLEDRLLSSGTSDILATKNGISIGIPTTDALGTREFTLALSMPQAVFSNLAESFTCGALATAGVTANVLARVIEELSRKKVLENVTITRSA